MSTARYENIGLSADDIAVLEADTTARVNLLNKISDYSGSLTPDEFAELYILKSTNEKPQYFEQRHNRQPIARILPIRVIEILNSTAHSGTWIVQAKESIKEFVNALHRQTQEQFKFRQATKFALEFGTHFVGPYWNQRLAQTQLRHLDLRHVKIRQDPNDADHLVMLATVDVSKLIGGETVKQTTIWNPEQIIIFYDDNLISNEQNRMGVIPFVAIRGNLSSTVGDFCGRSIVEPLVRITNGIHDALGSLAENIHHHTFPLAVRKSGSNLDQIELGPTSALNLGPGEDFAWKAPDPFIAEVKEAIDLLIDLGLMISSVPQAAIRTSVQPRSGKSLAMELMSLSDKVNEFITRWAEDRAQLARLMLLCDEVHKKGRIFTEQSARETMEKYEISITPQLDFFPLSPLERVELDSEEIAAGLATWTEKLKARRPTASDKEIGLLQSEIQETGIIPATPVKRKTQEIDNLIDEEI
ncbi:MAG: hypothetical protein ABIH23_06620 [bacterium]